MYNKGDVIQVKITKIMKTHIMVRPINANGWNGILHISEVSDYLVSNIKNLFKVNQKINLYVLSIDEKKKFINFSYKTIRPIYLKNPYEFTLKETKNKSKKLINKTMEILKND